ncbi:MAG: dTDP-4-dehydrorhamnose 3,5-epimerase [Desulfobacterales bacterium]|nr:dTDP-4-dehydrorhamnose 3,5-epimerase [Desulfobacterales bacterium]
MKYTPMHIPDMVMMTPDVHSDERGCFLEVFKDDVFREKVADVTFVQENQSDSVKGTLRGLHYQISRTQGKIIRVTSGVVFDVGVDLRKSSPFFGKWVGVTLSSESKNMLWLPPGFAHGFYVMSEQAQLIYKCTDYYAPEHERTLMWNDPEIGIKWPLSREEMMLVSEKDKNGVKLKDAEVFS